MVVVHFGGLRFEEGLDGSFIGESDPSFSQLEYQKLWPQLLEICSTSACSMQTHVETPSCIKELELVKLQAKGPSWLQWRAISGQISDFVYDSRVTGLRCYLDGRQSEQPMMASWLKKIAVAPSASPDTEVTLFAKTGSTRTVYISPDRILALLIDVEQNNNDELPNLMKEENAAQKESFDSVERKNAGDGTSKRRKSLVRSQQYATMNGTSEGYSETLSKLLVAESTMGDLFLLPRDINLLGNIQIAWDSTSKIHPYALAICSVLMKKYPRRFSLGFV